MEVTIIRHGKVNHTWKKWCSSLEFDEQCRLYDCASVEDMASAIDREPDKVYISTLDRSLRTAKMLFGERAFCRTEQLRNCK